MNQVKQIERLMKDADDERVLRYAAENEIESLRKQVADWKVECGHAEALAANCMAQVEALTKERDELCALLVQAEEALGFIAEGNHTGHKVAIAPALAAIKQWKEKE